MKFLYTVLFEFQGGIYIDQVSARDEDEAKLKWAKQLSHQEVFGLGEKTKDSLINEIRDQEPIDAKGVVNVWSLGVVFSGGYGNVTIIKMAS